MTRDGIAALLDGATPGLRGEALPDHDEDGDETDFFAVFMVQEANGDGTTTAVLCDLGDAKLYAAAPAIASAAIAAMDRETALLARVAEYDNAHERQAQTIMMLQATIATLRAQADMAAPDEGRVVHPDGSTGPVTMEYAKDYHVRTTPGWAPYITPDIRDTGETIWRCSMDNWTTGDAVGAESTISGAHAWLLAVEKAAKVRGE